MGFLAAHSPLHASFILLLVDAIQRPIDQPEPVQASKAVAEWRGQAISFGGLEEGGRLHDRSGIHGGAIRLALHMA